MSFQSVLRSIVLECGGGIGAVLMGSDGIAIEEFVTPNVPEGPGVFKARRDSTLTLELSGLRAGITTRSGASGPARA